MNMTTNNFEFEGGLPLVPKSRLMASESFLGCLVAAAAGAAKFDECCGPAGKAGFWLEFISMVRDDLKVSTDFQDLLREIDAEYRGEEPVRGGASAAEAVNVHLANAIASGDFIEEYEGREMARHVFGGTPGMKAARFD